MLRLLEAALFAAPLLVFLCARLVWRRSGPPAPVLAGALATLVALGAALAWMALRGGGAPDAAYHPATLDAGRVVPGRLGP